MNQLPLWRDPLPIEQWAYQELTALSDCLVDVQLVEGQPSTRYLAVFEAHYHNDDLAFIHQKDNWRILDEPDATGYVDLISRRGNFTLRWGYHYVPQCILSSDVWFLNIWGMLGYPDLGAELVIVPRPEEFPLPTPTGYSDPLKHEFYKWYTEQNTQYFINRYNPDETYWNPNGNNSFAPLTPEQAYVHGLIETTKRWQFEYAKWLIEFDWGADAELMDDLNELAEEYAHLSQQRAEHSDDNDDTLWKQLGKRSSMLINRDVRECVREFWERRQ